MTKRKIIVGAFLFFCGFFFFYFKKEEFSISTHDKKDSLKISVQKVPFQTQKATVLKTSSSSAPLSKTSSQWEKKLQKHLKAQARDSVKDIKVVKEKSLVYHQNQIPLQVESVLISLTNHQDVTSSFRALVDAKTGKVLETWDQTIFDPAEVRKEFRFKLDPRYRN
jgi:hypothetical protein